MKAFFIEAFDDESESKGEEGIGSAAGIIDLAKDTDTIRPFRVIISPTGDYSLETGSNILTVKDLAITKVAVPEGGYHIGLETTDYAENSSTTLVPVTIGGGPASGSGFHNLLSVASLVPPLSLPFIENN